ncbi:hypothetical protein Mp_1g00670 [Marchantia polymorpha subsp. ruderalis]|uniref:Uncharacterized protein n=2 Tax=Marchantia polymorpha TaxID=3197 RepID=A0AAF6AK11_MARPO|nr:hypothetical protein MARPO_0103s0021 [Marchantia polymorpha]BBM96781.1 hypothetical protein Mp_1g00670 [Marchantia polymorpha subsp. ruderalis]|eukprot:PTQ32048.1 hypothetical protein MARPO_0103s0021 [Marchantia polymorpha]
MADSGRKPIRYFWTVSQSCTDSDRFRREEVNLMKFI